MKISVRVKPNAKQERVEKTSASGFMVWVKATPHEGKANQAVIELLSRYFAVPVSGIVIVRGKHSRDKVVNVLS